MGGDGLEQPGASDKATVGFSIRRLPLWGWASLIVLLFLNLWFDYYHPGGFLIDVVILVWVIGRIASGNKLAQ